MLSWPGIEVQIESEGSHWLSGEPGLREQQNLADECKWVGGWFTEEVTRVGWGGWNGVGWDGWNRIGSGLS